LRDLRSDVSAGVARLEENAYRGSRHDRAKVGKCSRQGKVWE